MHRVDSLLPLQVAQVQRAFVIKLLSFNKFDRQLVAVREINQLLKRSMEISDVDGGKSTQVQTSTC